MSERSFAHALAAAAGVPGWLTDAQAHRLWAAARQVQHGATIVEIGSFRGRSTIVLARAAADDVEVVAIDPHLGGDRGPRELAERPALGEADRVAFADNLRRAGVADRVRHVRARSATRGARDAVRGEIALVYVDGAHRARPAAADLRLWGARVAPGGTLLVHDAFSSIGVTLALLGTVVGRGGWRYRGRSGSLAEYRHGPELTPAGRTLEVARALSQLPWFARNLAVKIALVARQRWAARLLGHRTGDWPY